MVEEAKNLMLVKDIMSTPVCSVTLNHSVFQVLKLTKEKNVTGFPVLDADKKVIGVVSSFDLITEVAVGKQHLKLGELPLIIKVEKDVVHLTPDTSVKEAIIVFIKKRVGRIVIIDETNGLCGIVSRKDIIKYFLEINNLS